MIPAHETFDGTWPFAPHFSSAAGFRQHYVDEGPRDGEVILCLHGEPTWGYLYRHFIPTLSRHYRVIVPDHMGFGKSETPQDRVYTLETHVNNLAALIDDLQLEQVSLVCQDWGGPMTGAYAIRHPQRVSRLMLMNTLFGYGRVPAPAGRTPWFEWIAQHEEAGTLEGVLGEMGSTILSIMKRLGFTNSAAVTDSWLRAYAAPFPDRASCIGAIAFPLDVHYARMTPYIMKGFTEGDLAALKAKPAMLAYGMADRAIDPAHAIADFRALFPDAPVVELENVGHFCQEDAPQTLVALIHQFMQMTR
ncbi:MAG: alpha/beta fold hydrolase [Pseudomonadales bacterium]|jgi:haloalkane dehalogenase|nr:alpha/beta fold hydrolase [Pseudomonadales bacterium]